MAQDQSIADKLILALGELGYLDENLTAFRLQRAYLNTGAMQTLMWDFIRPEDLASWNALTRYNPGDPSR